MNAPTDLSRLLVLRDAGAIQRYHTARMVRPQNLAEHSFGVALILMHLFPDMVHGNLLRAALYHDLSEHATGDIPAPVKWDSPELRHAIETLERRYDRSMGLEVDLTREDKHALKWADMFELVLWCYEETLLGNTYAEDIMHRGINYLIHELGPCTPEAGQLLFKLSQKVNAK